MDDQLTIPGTPEPSPPPSRFLRPLGGGRPREHDDDVLEEAAEIIFNALAKLSPKDFPETERDGIIDDLVDEIAFYHDGYELGKQLENMHQWTMTFDQAEILDGAEDAIWEAHESFVEAWVEAEHITPTFSVGDHVMIVNPKISQAMKITTPNPIFTIRAVDAKTAQYTVYSTEPHGRCAGDLSDEQILANRTKGGAFTPGTNGHILNYEDVGPAPA